MGGFGGAIENLSIGFASGMSIAKSICDYMQNGKGIICVNVMNRGILSSIDLVALNQAEKIGFGNRYYRLVEIK